MYNIRAIRDLDREVGARPRDSITSKFHRFSVGSRFVNVLGPYRTLGVADDLSRIGA